MHYFLIFFISSFSLLIAMEGEGFFIPLELALHSRTIKDALSACDDMTAIKNVPVGQIPFKSADNKKHLIEYLESVKHAHAFKNDLLKEKLLSDSLLKELTLPLGLELLANIGYLGIIAENHKVCLINKIIEVIDIKNSSKETLDILNNFTNDDIVLDIQKEIIKREKIDIKLMKFYTSLLKVQSERIFNCYSLLQSNITKMQLSMIKFFYRISSMFFSDLVFETCYYNAATRILIQSVIREPGIYDLFIFKNRNFITKRFSFEKPSYDNNFKAIEIINANTEETVFICCYVKNFFIIDLNDIHKAPTFYRACAFTPNEKNLYVSTYGTDDFGIINIKNDVLTPVCYDIQDKENNKKKSDINEKEKSYIKKIVANKKIVILWDNEKQLFINTDPQNDPSMFTKFTIDSISKDTIIDLCLDPIFNNICIFSERPDVDDKKSKKIVSIIGKNLIADNDSSLVVLSEKAISSLNHSSFNKVRFLSPSGVMLYGLTRDTLFEHFINFKTYNYYDKFKRYNYYDKKNKFRYKWDTNHMVKISGAEDIQLYENMDHKILQTLEFLDNNKISFSLLKSLINLQVWEDKKCLIEDEGFKAIHDSQLKAVFKLIASYAHKFELPKIVRTEEYRMLFNTFLWPAIFWGMVGGLILFHIFIELLLKYLDKAM